MVVEYLIVTYQDECFCNSIEAFNNLLQADSQISINKSKLCFSVKAKKIDIDYLIETGEIAGEKQRFFHLKLSIDEDQNINELTQLVRRIKKIASKINHDKTKISTLWDDISMYYTIKSYPIISEIENLMRKLILKFMIVNVGINWISEAMPNEVKKKILNKEKLNNSSNSNIVVETLHNADFIVLSDFLFEKYRNKDITLFDNLISKRQDSDTINVGDLKNEFFPISNWDRYFSSVINYKGDLFKEEWEQLYDLRNKIAHNKTLNKKEFDDINKISSNLKKVLNDAISSLDKLELSNQDKVNIITSSHNANSARMGFVAEQAVAEWYAEKNTIDHIMIEADTGKDTYVDILATTNNNFKIGVEVKYTSSNSFRSIRNQFAHGRDINRYIPKDLEYFNEFHLVIVLRDTNNEVVDKFGHELKHLISSLNSKLKLIIGRLNTENKFEPL